MKTKRRFVLGDEWIYYKIYASIETQSKLLPKEIYEIVNELYSKKLISNFFFIRYHDNDGSHLRLRFKLNNTTDIQTIIKVINNKLGSAVTQRTIHKIMTDTYVRELERYGTEYIENIETLFSLDSLLVLNLLRKRQKGKLTETDMWLSAVRKFDYFMSASGYTVNDKQKVYESLFQNSLFEFDKIQLKNKYRENRIIIEHFLECGIFKISKLEQEYQQQLTEIINRSELNSDTNTPPIHNIFQHLIHMTFNRLFSHEQNIIEAIVYFFMSNYYKSLLIRNDHKKQLI